MSPELVGLIGIIVLLILLILRMWVGATMLVVGILGCAYLGGLDQAFTLIGLVPYSQTANYTMAAVPMFIFMGVILSVSGIGADLYYAVRKWLGNVRGGLAIATVGACGFFAAVCGDSTATAVTMGKVAYPEMKKYKYSDRLAASCIAAGGTVGILIPPSIGFIIYGLITEQSIGKLFMAGIIPGILQVIFYMATIYIICSRDPLAGPLGPKSSFGEKMSSLKAVLPTLVIFFLIVIGLYGGFFTPTEAGAFGAFAAIVTSYAMGRLKKDNFGIAIKETMMTTAMVFFLLIGAYVFMRFMALSHLPVSIGNYIVNISTVYNIPRIFILIAIVLVYLVTGCFLDILAAILLTLPIIYPVIIGLNYDPIWWGVMMVRIMEISMITPPFGLNLFTLSRTINVSLKNLYYGIFPFVVADFVHVALLIAIPEMALFLPNNM
jgi:C4-dicarboxylate transporter DctM subunit